MLSILRVSKTGASIGFEDGSWFVETGRGSVSLEQPSGVMGVLPLLERPYSEVYQELQASLEEHWISPRFAASFPAEMLVSFALQTGSAYWKEQAFKWVEELPVSEEFIDPLKKICKNRAWSQAVRRGAQQCLKSLRQRVTSKED